MIAGVRPSSQVRDTVVSWVAEVPEHWDVVRLRNAAEMRVSNVDKHSKADEQPVRLCNYVDVYKHDRIRSTMAFMGATATGDEIERFRLQPGDVLITKDSETWNDIGVPALVEDAADDLISGYHLALLRPLPHRIDGRFLFRALQSAAVSHQFHVEANGVTRYGLSHSAIKAAWIPMPPLAEQGAIVRFLDYVDRRIGRYIGAKAKLIKLLEEQKQTVIHRAVTRGLDPDVRLKPSGVEWLRDVPEHWHVCALGRVAVAWCDGPFGSSLKSSHYVEQGIRVVRLQNIGHGEFKDASSVFIAPEHYATLGDHGVEDGDLLIAGLGDDRHPAGRACVAPRFMTPAMVKADCLRFRLDRSRVVPDFLALHLSATAQVAAAALSTGATRQRINLSNTAARPIALPPLEEQSQIADTLRRATAGLLRTIEHARHSTQLLREYRIRLSADVVTGKLDVREAVTRLPDEAEESEPLTEFDALTDLEDGVSDELEATLHEVEA